MSERLTALLFFFWRRIAPGRRELGEQVLDDGGASGLFAEVCALDEQRILFEVAVKDPERDVAQERAKIIALAWLAALRSPSRGVT